MKVKEFISAVRRWVRTDGLLHILASAVVVFTFGMFLPWWFAVLAGIGVGIVKEIYDRLHGGSAEWHDVLCDIIGVIYSGGLLWLF